MEERESVLVGEGKETGAQISSPPHVVAGSRAVVKRGGVVQGQALGGQWGRLKQGGPPCRAFTLFLFRGS